MRGPPDTGGAPEGPSAIHVAPESRFFRRLGELVVRHRWWVLIVNMAISLAFVGVTLLRFEISNSFEAFMDPDSGARTTLEAVREAFGADHYFFVLAEGDVYTLDYLERLRALHGALEGVQRASDVDVGAAEVQAGGLDDFDDAAWGDVAGGSVVDDVISLVNVRDTRWDDGALRVAGLLDEWPLERELPALRARVEEPDRTAGRFVAPTGEMSVLIVRTVPLDHDELGEVYDALLATARAHDAEGFRVSVGGAPALYAVFDRMTSADLFRLTTTVVLLLLGVFAVMFRSALRALTPLTTVLHALAWAVGVMALLGLPLTLVTIVLYPLLICVGLAAGIHVEIVYLHNRVRGLSVEDAVVGAVAATGVPVLLTSLTTAVGLLSYLLTGIPPVRDLGLMGAFGALVGRLQAVTGAPALLCVVDGGPVGERPTRGQVLFGRVAALGERASRSPRRVRNILAVSALLMVVAVGGLAQVRVTHDTMTYLPRHHEVRATTDRIGAEIGGTSNISVLVEADDVRSLDVLRGLDAVEQELRAYRDAAGEPLVHAVEGLTTLLREGQRALAGGHADAYRLPETQQGVYDTLTLLESESPEQVRRTVTLDATQLLVDFQVPWRGSAEYRPLADLLEDSLTRHVRPFADARATGSVLGNVTVESELTGGLFKSLSVAGVAIFLLMIVLLRSVRLGLIAMVPNLAPIALTLAFMGFTGIPIDVQNVLIASLVLGIAVDDTIHFFHQFRAHYDHNGDREAAIRFAFQHAGVAIVTTSALLAIGFGAHAASIMANTRVFGILVALAIAFAFLADLLLAPALLRALIPARKTPGVPHGSEPVRVAP